MSIPGVDGMTSATLMRREFSQAALGDARKTARLMKLAEACASAPGESLPKASGTKRDLEGAYRFFGNAGVSSSSILRPHQLQTVERSAAAGVILSISDTTELVFNGEREGLGRLRGVKDKGFLLHATLAVSADGHRRPLGLLGAHTWIRTGSARCKKANGVRRSGSEYMREGNKESARWGHEMLAAHELLGGRARVIHLADREADAFELLATLVEGEHRFVIRVRTDRTTVGGEEPEKVSAACARQPLLVDREVALTHRTAKQIPGISKTLASRKARIAKLAVSAVRVVLRKPAYVASPATLPLNVVRVFEVDPPADAEPVEWRLYTTEPIDTAEQLLAIVDYYRARWTIEEFFKALKTGCQIEKLQLMTYDALTRALAVYLVIAWTILVLRSLARDEPDTPAQAALSQSQIDVLRAVGPMKLPPSPTVAQAMLAVAMLGGYIKHKIPPGWIVLSRGMQDLLNLERGWRARASDGCAGS
ncbi:MAG: IS4 family transposase [Polyangiaceae bacterium]